MSQTQQLVGSLKQVLRNQKITYAQVALKLEMSEASVKRMFSKGSFTLERLEQIADIANVRIAELATMADEAPQPITHLTPDQENQLIEDGKLLLVAFMVLNGWTIEQVTATFDIEELEMVRKLAQLDRLGMVELLPGNRVRRLVSRNFSWRKNGPVARYFEREIKKDLLDSRFAGAGEHLRFVGGLMSRSSLRRMHQSIEDLAQRFDELVQQDSDLETHDKVGVGAVFAIRPWEAPPFRLMRRNKSARNVLEQDSS